MLPSVVLFTTTFCVDWSSSEWLRREAALQERFLSLRSSLGYREAKIIIVAIKTGDIFHIFSIFHFIVIIYILFI
jgi:hypothetical protein